MSIPEYAPIFMCQRALLNFYFTVYIKRRLTSVLYTFWNIFHVICKSVTEEIIILKANSDIMEIIQVDKLIDQINVPLIFTLVFIAAVAVQCKQAIMQYSWYIAMVFFTLCRSPHKTRSSINIFTCWENELCKLNHIILTWSCKTRLYNYIVDRHKHTTCMTPSSLARYICLQ